MQTNLARLEPNWCTGSPGVPGVYEVMFNSRFADSCFARWTGAYWTIGFDNPDEAGSEVTKARGTVRAWRVSSYQAPSSKETQGRRLIAHLKRQPMTYLEMQQLGISTSPQKRIKESLREGEHLFKRKNARGLITWMVTK